MAVKQTLTIGISFLLFLIFFISPVYAESGKLYEVGTDAIEMKSAPEQQAEVIGLLVRGDKLTTFQEKFGWVQTYYDGEEVWVASQYLIPINVDDQNATDSEPKPDPKEKTKPALKTDNTANKSGKKNIVESYRMIAGSLEITNNTLPAKNKGSNGSLSGYHIVIDPGHGGKDVGAIGFDKVHERELTLSTAKLVAEKLHDEGATVTLTRSNDTYVSLDKRVQISNTLDTNVFISLHYNAFKKPTVGGINTFYYNGEEGLKLAKSIQKSLLNQVNLNNRGAKQANYYVLRKNSDLALLVELGFITNPEELKKIQTTEYQEKVAEGIADGLKDYFDN